MRDISTWRRALPVALILALLVVTEAGLIAQNLGSAPQTNVAVQGQTGAQTEGTWLNLINWIGNVMAPVGAGGAALAAIISFAAGKGPASRCSLPMCLPRSGRHGLHRGFEREFKLRSAIPKSSRPGSTY